MIIWILLLSLFCESTQDGNGKENGVLHCEPQNMRLTTPDQKILLTWEDDPSCLAVHDVLMYEVVVLIADQQVHNDTVAVTPDQIGSTHSWNWKPHLPLECASHSVRLSSRYKNRTSPWKQEQTHPGIGNPKTPEVFPRDRVFKVGSRATFCCVVPVGDTFDRMDISRYSGTYMNTTKISNQTYALTINLDQASNTYCTDVKCHTKTQENGACAYIGYPPDDSNLLCETRDLQSVECLWTVGNDTRVKNKTEYHLLGRECNDTSEGKCSQEVQVRAGEQNWTLTAQNSLGTVELTDRADLTKRVHMFAPLEVTASAVNARNVSLEWGWKAQQYNNLNITCQVNVSNGEINSISENFGVGLNFTVLDDLIPDWAYTVMVRCGTTHYFWKWSEWSSSIQFHTKGDVPDALDVWMQMKDNQLTIIWKMLQANQSHGHIIDHEVTWAHTNTPERQNRTKVAHPKDSLALSLNTTEEYIISVTARNINGSSSPSTITTSIHHSFNSANGVIPSRILGSNGGFNLSWSASPIASCGYIVDWCPALGESRVEWVKVPPSETNASIFSENFKDGLRYLLSIYACTQGAPVLLERREGYVREKRIQDGLFETLTMEQQDSDVVVSWHPISLRKQTAFIKGYILYALDNNNNSIVINVSKEDPETTSLTARNLKISTYTFTVKAQTAVGECGTSFISATLNSPTDYLITAVFISLVTVFGLLSLTTILCYRHWTCIKHNVYPPIPKPVLTDKWLSSPGEHSCRPLRVDLCQHSEALITDVPELHRKSVAPGNDYISQDKTPCVFTQTQMGYYNQPLKKNTPPPIILPTAIPSGLPSSPFKRLFPNPSYDLIMQTGDQQSNSGPDFHKGTPLERCSSGYQPQSLINQPEEDPDSPLSCVFTYILLPNSS
ncbi:leukemia inhibitory factor receptor-like isoform X1 [Thunnus maccoyii]|uniref:leukemia inhibitory factor receptor-like isoform X1 n=1 Tax=Thunnus maccoyii TaxID=8240 RepID=UPI001C4BAC45|nr:leukemia inhibitory factor receptor-like isoform X1 [Thunnus maccoyii]